MHCVEFGSSICLVHETVGYRSTSHCGVCQTQQIHSRSTETHKLGFQQVRSDLQRFQKLILLYLFTDSGFMKMSLQLSTVAR